MKCPSLYARISVSAALGRGVRGLLQPLALAVLAVLLRPPPARADELGSALYVRTDTDTTTVVSPRVRAHEALGETTIDAVYAVDVWSSASIDIRASASKKRVTEQRDELDLTLAHPFADLRLHAGYRLSIENDYDSNGVSAGFDYDLADNAATLSLSVSAIHDVVGRSGDPQFGRRLDTLNSRLSFTQVIDPDMFVQLIYELDLLDGYQASPYRYVGIMGSGFGCEDALDCLPERVPDGRVRHALALSLRRALSGEVSLGAIYRYYVDDWGLRSHTAIGDVGWNAGQDTLVSLHLRYYTQSAVDFYREVYEAPPAPGGHLTRDRELSAMRAQRLGLDLQQRIGFDDDAERLTLSLDIAGANFDYDQFVGLSDAQALEVTFAMELAL